MLSSLFLKPSLPGCNRLVGSYAVENDTVTLSQLAGAMVACPEPAMVRRDRGDGAGRSSPHQRGRSRTTRAGRRSSGEMKWSLSSLPTSSWTQWILPVNLLA